MVIEYGCASYQPQKANMVETPRQLERFLTAALPEEVPFDKSGARMQTREEYIKDVADGVAAATMTIRMT